MRHSFAVSALAAATAFPGLLAAQAPGKVDFRRDIQPLFQEKCIGCHGPSQQSAGMRLDRRSSPCRLAARLDWGREIQLRVWSTSESAGLATEPGCPPQDRTIRRRSN